MIKFLDRFGLDKTDIRQVFPDYDKLFADISRLQSKIKEGVSTQAENEYISIINSMDDFLMRDENIQKFRDVLGLPMIIDKGGTDFTQDEAIEYLEDEIFELEKAIPADIINSQKEKDSLYKKSEKINIDLSKRIERYDDRGGIKFKYIQFKREPFNRCLSMLNSGCKFLYRTFGDINYILFPLNDEVKLIVETSTPIKDYESIFGGSSDVMAYILCKNKGDIEKYYKILRSAFDELESEPYIKIDDDALFNNPPLIGAFIEEYLYQKADEIVQNGIRDSRDVENLFSLSLPLQKYLTLRICSTIYSNRNMFGIDTLESGNSFLLKDEEIKNKIIDVIKTQSYHLEGVGGVPHSFDVLDDLVESKLLTDLYQPTSKGFKLIELNSENLNPAFRASQYYKTNIESEFKKSKNKFSSIFGMDVLYHIKNEYSNIEIALALTTSQVKKWGFDKANQINSFSTKYQELLNDYEYIEFLPFGSESELNLNVSNTKRDEKSQNLKRLYFKDTDRNKLFISSVKNPVFTWGVNSFNYNFLKKLYPKKNLRLFAPNIPSFQLDTQVFIKVLDEDDNLIALLKPLSFSKKELSLDKKQKQQFIDWRNKKIKSIGVLAGITITQKEWIESEKIPIQTTIIENYLEMRLQPIPVWDFDKTMYSIEKTYPDFVNQGEWLKDVGDLTPYSDSIITDSDDIISEDIDQETPFIPEVEPKIGQELVKSKVSKYLNNNTGNESTLSTIKGKK